MREEDLFYFFRNFYQKYFFQPFKTFNKIVKPFFKIIFFDISKLPPPPHTRSERRVEERGGKGRGEQRRLEQSACPSLEYRRDLIK